MKLTVIADACHVFEHDGIRVLCDPWIGTATNGFWLQYPPPKAKPDEIGRLDYIFISHLHEDHCDFATLERLDRSARILIMERKPNLLRSHLVNHGIAESRITAIPPRETIRLGADLAVEPLEPNPAHEYSRLVDSALLLHYSGRTIYFANDSEPYEGSDRYLAERYRVDLAMMPFYGGSGYPACYTNLTDAEKKTEVARIQKTYLASMARSMSIVKPRAVMPIASWHCFGGRIAALNPVMSWPQSFAPIVEFMRGLGSAAPELWLLNPGQSIDVATGEREGGAFIDFAPSERQSWASTQLPNVRPHYEHIPNSPAIRLDRLFQQACSGFRERARYDFPPGFRYLFDCGEGVRYVLDPSTGQTKTETSNEMPAPPYLKATMDRRHFALLLIGALSWNLEDASGLMRYERVPNEYYPEIYVALNYIKI